MPEGEPIIRQKQILAGTPGPAPWYWSSYPEPVGASGRKYTWMYHGDEGPVGYLVTLARRQDPNTPLLALNTYCRPFLLPASANGGSGNYLGIWCPEPGYLRLVCFDPDALAGFPLTEVAGWFKQSTERLYSATEPVVEAEISSRLSPGAHPLELPGEFRGIPELLMITSYAARKPQDAACAILIVKPQQGQVEVIPQRWFTPGRYEIGRQWITRVARDPLSGRIIGEGFRIGSFELTEDGAEIARWLE